MTTPGSRSPSSTSSAAVDDRALDAAARHRARDLAGVVHGHRRARDRAAPSRRARRRARPRPGGRSARQRSMSSRTSFMRALAVHALRDHLGQVLERRERVALDELVNVRQRGRHSPGERRELGRRLQRVHPHDPVRDPVQPRHLLGEHLGIAAVPAVGEDHDDRAAGHAPHAPLVVELRAAPRRGGCRPTSRRPARPRRRARRRDRATTARG